MTVNINKIESEGLIATVDAALKDADSYVVEHNLLGWGLRHMDSSFTTLISQADALRIITAHQATQPAGVAKLPYSPAAHAAKIRQQQQNGD